MQHQEVLMLLNRDRSENRSIAVFVVHSVADIPSTIGSGADLWRLFAHDVLLPRTMPGDDAPPEAKKSRSAAEVAKVNPRSLWLSASGGASSAASPASRSSSRVILKIL